MPRERSQTWTWEFDHPPEAVWPIMADTQRFNEAAGLPRYQTQEIVQPDGSVAFFGDARIGPWHWRWREIPVNWVAGQWLEHRREFLGGPLRSLTADIRLAPIGRGAELRYTLTAEPRNLLGEALLRGGLFRSSGKTFARLAHEANEFLAGRNEMPFFYEGPKVAPELAQRVARMVEAIEATPYGHGLAKPLADFVLESQEVDLWRIRPLALARRWSAGTVATIEMCLQAVRQGLLEMRWDLLCPRCRVAKAWSGGLDQLPTGAHCSSCNIDYGRDFSRNVEASFHPAPAIRKLESGEYCLWGPMSVPHVKVQIALRPGETRLVPAQLTAGAYRVRTLEPGPELEIAHEGGGFPAVQLNVEAIAASSPGASGEVRMENRTPRNLVAVIEDRNWIADALTGDRLTALQGYRDLFADDVLRPGDEVAVRRVALLFSDLKGSTELYQRIGDARAYHLVREHFALLAQTVRANEGAIVKTIGDAVMAAFFEPAKAMRAAIDILAGVERFNADRRAEQGQDCDIIIKLGVHVGPAIVVNLNDRLDYFGSTVNLASRLQGLAEGGEIVVSREAAAEPGVKELIATLRRMDAMAELKGFADAIPILRCLR